VFVFLVVSQYRQALTHWEQRQSSIADERARLVSNWLQERKGDAEANSRSPEVKAYLSRTAGQAGVLCRAPDKETVCGTGAAAAPSGELDVFDHAALLKRWTGDRALAEKVVNASLERARPQLSSLRRQLAAQNAQGARREAHALRGAAATVSAPAMRGLALEAEQAAAAGDWTRFEEILPRMEDQLDRLKTAIAHCQWAGETINITVAI
jgi:HPt (histidine-containing phosphotransfer) domain-containing protein